MTLDIKLSREALGLIKHSLGVRNMIGLPVEVIHGIAMAPRIKGRSGGYFKNSTGERVPNSYHRVGWSSCHYGASTLRVEVGADWLRIAGI